MGNVLPFAAPARAFFDGLANLMSRLGTSADRNARSTYYVPLLTQADCEAAYRSSWLARKVHDLPPFEMTRAGRAWQAEADQIETLEALELKLGLWQKIRQVLTVARLHGGAALILGVRSGMPDQELSVDAVGKNALRYVFVASRYQLTAPRGFDTDPESDYFGQPVVWAMSGARGNRVEIHPSRVICFHGAPLPPGIITVSQIDQFWGDPLLTSIKSAIENADTTQIAIATLLHEMKQDVISIPGLTEQIATKDAEARLGARVEALNQFKNMFSTLLLDRGDGANEASGEKWETRQLSFAQHPELLRAFLGIVAGAADIPVTRLMGESPGGLQSTGKGEQDDFNRMIQAKQTADLAPALVHLDEILIRSALGSRPPEIYYEFAPLEEADPKEAAEIEKLEAETVDLYVRGGLIPSDAMAKALVNRMTESGRWPGLDQAIEESPDELGAPPDEPLVPANENDVQQMQQRGNVTRDQALSLLVDAAPRSLYVSRRLLNAAEFIAWAKRQGFETTQTADQLHVTVYFSRTPVDWMKVGESSTWGEKDGKLTVQPGGPRLVEGLGDKGAVVLLFGSDNLTWRNQDIRRIAGDEAHEQYQPHVTITYEKPDGLDLSTVEPFTGALVFGPEIFAEVVDDWEKGTTER